MSGGRKGTVRADNDFSGIWTFAEVAERKLAGTWGVPDPYFSNVVALLHFDGADCSTTFTDVKGHAFTAVGNAQIDTAYSKFGSAALLLDGSGDRVSGAASTDWGISTGDWTIEMWVNLDVASGVENGICCRRSGGTNGWAIDVGTSGQVRFRANIGGTWSDTWMSTPNGTIVAGTGAYCGFKRAGNVFSTWVGGVQKSTFTNSGAISNQSGEALVIGAASSSGENSFDGWIDELRFTKGVARDLSVVPTTPFPNF